MSRDGARDEIRRLEAEILEKTRELARLRISSERGFTPGRSRIGYAGRVYDEKELENLVKSSLDFWLTAGPYHRRLELGLAKWFGVPHAVLANSGSSANLLATAALTSPEWGERRLEPGDEVITAAAGFPTTVAAIIQQQAVPVFVDASLPTCNIDASLLEEARSPRTKAVMAAHTLGNPFDLDAVRSFCKKHGLWLIEDNCDAAGSLYDGKKTGTFGDMATLSFYPPHHMTMGEGGAVLCSSEAIKKVVESFRDWGRDCWCLPGVDNTCGRRFDWSLGDLPCGYDHKYTYSRLGYNLKITDMQAAVGLAQLDKLAGFVKSRRENWAYFREELNDLLEFLDLPEPTPKSEPSWFGFLMLVKPGAPFSREEIVRHLESKNIQTRMLFAGNLVRQPAFAQLKADAARRKAPEPFRVAGDLRNTDRIMKDGFWIGVYPGITPEMRYYIVEQIRGFVLKRSASGKAAR